MADLKPRQYKRLGRIEERNPERAARVAERMEKRASSTERGKAIASNAEEKRTGGRAIGRDKGMTREAFSSRSESLKREAVQKFRGKGEAMSKEQFDAKKAELKNQASKKMTKRPDTPLATSPIPSFLKNR